MDDKSRRPPRALEETSLHPDIRCVCVVVGDFTTVNCLSLRQIWTHLERMDVARILDR